MNDQPAEPENLDDYDVCFASDAQLLESQAPLPTRTMPRLDSLTDGMRGVTLVRGDPSGVAGMLAVQAGVDAVVNSPATCLAVFRDALNGQWLENHVRWHGLQSGDAVSKHILTWSRGIDGRIPVPETELRWAVERAKKAVGAERAIVLVDDQYRYRRLPKRRTWAHALNDRAFAKRLRDAQRASGDAWIVVADHDMAGCFDRVIECERQAWAPGNTQAVLSIHAGEARDLVGRIGLEYAGDQLRFKELPVPVNAEDRCPL